MPEDKAIAQDLAYETIHRLVESPEDVVGCMLAYRERGAIEAIPDVTGQIGKTDRAAGIGRIGLIVSKKQTARIDQTR